MCESFHICWSKHRHSIAISRCGSKHLCTESSMFAWYAFGVLINEVCLVNLLVSGSAVSCCVVTGGLYVWQACTVLLGLVTFAFSVMLLSPKWGLKFGCYSRNISQQHEQEVSLSSNCCCTLLNCELITVNQEMNQNLKCKKSFTLSY